jgi:hypothetical protein
MDGWNLVTAIGYIVIIFGGATLIVTISDRRRERP